ncbi:MAG: GMP synthase (glutamine-hydrolyzing), partial [Maricaulis sp.]
MTDQHEKALIIDFGSQVTQLIARRLRESGVFCEVHPYNRADKAFIDAYDPKAIILSGSPHSTHWDNSPKADPSVFTRGIPVLGICYGEQTMCSQLGGKVEASEEREFGRADITITADSPLFAGFGPIGHEERVWMSHGDRVSVLPEGFQVIARSGNAPYAAIADEARKFYAVQFHPEVVHTPRGALLLKNFTH